MANKTIYVQDEALWKRAKKLAGKTGLSGVIAKALQEYVDRHDGGFERFQFEAVDGDDPGYTPDFVAFDGKCVASATLKTRVDELQVAAAPIDVSVYRTRGGSLVLTAHYPDQGDLITHWARHDSLSELGKDKLFEHVESDDRASLLQATATALGKDFVTWIE